MDYDKILTYLVSIATIVNLLSSSAKNINDMKSKKKEKRRTPTKKKRRK
ncbi:MULTISPECIES: hypothetical protein [Lysinibacillus]|uniref:Uncharacterized protein n=1 Tax=Lysinibacillus xylanilyticus TaxID=582475 RepID=A0ABV3VUR9_9BACI